MMRSPFDMFACSCGKTFRSYAAEARHRHNFPLLCRPARPSSFRDGDFVVTGHASLSPEGQQAMNVLVKAAAKAMSDARADFDSEQRTSGRART